MIGMLRRRRAARRRLIYRYFDGRRYVWADPLALWVDLLSVDFDWEEALREAEAGNKEKIEQIREALTRVFRAVPFDPATGEGLTLWELVAELERFVAWLEDLKKKHARGPTPLLLSVWNPSDSPADADSANTNSGAGSCCNASASSDGGLGGCSRPSAGP